jgi:Tfp pilus assembly protein PilP
MPFSLTSADLMYAAIIAIPLTWMIRSLFYVFKSVISRTTEFNYHPNNLENVLERCYFMFPNEHFRFNGSTFSRGMLVKVITIKRRTIVGQFVGCNKDNVVCVITDDSVIAQGINDIEEINEV